MEVVAPAFLPDPALDRGEMEAMQRAVAADARFVDDLGFEPAAIGLDDSIPPDEAIDPVDDPTSDEASARQTRLDDAPTADSAAADPTAGAAPPLVAGVDQAFTDDEAVSAVVVLRGSSVVERAVGRAPLEIPYVPGLLSFREAGAIVSALEALETDPDLLVLDGSGRIHYRQAGIATHVGVLFDVPAVGVAKSLLCGRPRESLDEPLAEGRRVAIEADGQVEALGSAESAVADSDARETDPDWPVIGHAYQSRQFANPSPRHVNPLYVSPGHRVGAATAVDLVAALSAGYKLPEPTRLADAYADEVR